jgi:hypothetical protein
MTQKRRERLPQDVTDAFDSIDQLPNVVLGAYAYLLRDKGWSLPAIGAAANYSTSYLAKLAQKIGDTAEARDTLSSYSVETLPVPAPTEPTRPRSPKTLPPEIMWRLNQLHLFAAARCGGNKYKSEAEEYTALLWHAHIQYGMSFYRLAKLLDVTAGSIHARLVRYGYKTSRGSSAAVKPLKSKTTA